MDATPGLGLSGILISVPCGMPVTESRPWCYEPLYRSIPVLSAPEMMRSVRSPLARTLYCYTAWEPSGTVKEFIDFCLSSRGHVLVQKAGYVVMSSTAPCPRSRTRLVLVSRS